MQSVLLEATLPTVDMTSSLQGLVDSAVSMATSAAPIIIGGVAAFAAVKIGIRVFKSFASKFFG